jgi:hypothetical protein
LELPWGEGGERRARENIRSRFYSKPFHHWASF